LRAIKGNKQGTSHNSYLHNIPHSLENHANPHIFNGVSVKKEKKSRKAVYLGSDYLRVVRMDLD